MELVAGNQNHCSNFSHALRFCCAKLSQLWRSQRSSRSLIVKETAGLGERRFVAIVQFERQRFLVGGSANAVTLLATLPNEHSGEER